VVKEAIFNALGPAVTDAVVLDLFAGSGALGIEALSRGAARALFVDRDEDSVRVVRRNLEALELAERGRAVRAEVTRWLAGHAGEVTQATLALLDPPYNDPVLEHALVLLDSLVAEGTIVVVEHGRRQVLPALHRLRPSRQRRYGDTAVSVLLAR
jgi:16S rRNA (guanine(966)-N(2))-methyltransferase RsmD